MAEDTFIIESMKALQKEVDSKIEESMYLQQNMDLKEVEENITNAFVEQIVNNATAEGFNAFFSRLPEGDIGGKLLAGRTVKADALKNKQSLSNAYGDFLETDLFGISQLTDIGGRATEKGDISDIFNLGYGRYEVKGTTPVSESGAIGTKKKYVIGVGEKLGFIPQELYASLNDIEKNTISINIASLKLMEKMRNFIYILLSEAVGRGRVHYKEIILYSQLIAEVLIKMLTYGSTGGMPFYVEPGNWHKNKDGFFVKKIEIRMNEKWFKLAEKSLDYAEIKKLYRIRIDLLEKVKESDSFRARFFKTFSGMELTEML